MSQSFLAAVVTLVVLALAGCGSGRDLEFHVGDRPEPVDVTVVAGADASGDASDTTCPRLP